MANVEKPTIKIIEDPAQDPLSILSSIVVNSLPEMTCEDQDKTVSISVTKRVKSRSRQKYRKSWEDYPAFHTWLTSDPNSEFKAVCKACNMRFTADITVVKNHSKGKKHSKKLGEYKANRARPRVRKRAKVKKEEPVDYTSYDEDFSIPRPTSPVEAYEEATPRTSREAKLKLMEFIHEMGTDHTNFARAKNLVNQCFYQQEAAEDKDSVFTEGNNMSHHVPLTCRDPFFRDLDRDFFRDRSSRKTWFDSSPSKLFDQHFGVGVWPDDVQNGTSSLYLRSRRPPRERSGISFIENVQEKFSILLDVPHFTPDELKVRVTGGNALEVEGKHDERQDEHGTVSRQFTRKYILPEDVMLDMISSSLSAEGVLTIEAPKKPPEPPRPAEREVPIQKMDKNNTNKV